MSAKSKAIKMLLQKSGLTAGKASDIRDALERIFKSKKGAIDAKAVGTYKMPIDDFLDLTSEKDLIKWLKDPKTEIKIKDDHVIMPFLEIDTATGEVIGHEGRHRAAKMLKKGAKDMDIAIYPYPKHREHAESMEHLPEELISQFTKERKKFSPKQIKQFKQNIEGHDPNTGLKRIFDELEDEG